MKLLRGANLWLNNNSNAAPFGPHGVYFWFWGFSEPISSYSLTFSGKRRKKNWKAVHI